MLKLAFKPVLHEDCLRQWLSGATDQVLVVVASVMMKHEETGAQGSEEYCVAFGLELCLSLVGARWLGKTSIKRSTSSGT